MQLTPSPQEIKDRCSYLNTVRANFTVCCQYPSLVLWRWQLNQCIGECQNINQIDNSCCISVCNYRLLSVIPQPNNNANNASFDPTEGLITAFMLSIGNTSEWTQTIRDSCTLCNNAVGKQPEYDSCGIPIHLYSIVNCAYNEMFFNCPKWNPSNIQECDFTRQFIDTCYRNNK